MDKCTWLVSLAGAATVGTLRGAVDILLLFTLNTRETREHLQAEKREPAEN